MLPNDSNDLNTRRAIVSQASDSCQYIHKYNLDLILLRVILGVIRALVSTWPLTRKRLVEDRNGVKCRTLNTRVTAYYRIHY